MSLSNVQGAYTIVRDDITNYSYKDYDGSIWGFTGIYQNTDTGEECVQGATPWWGGTHTCRLDMYVYFQAQENGRVYCSAEWSLSYRLEAVTTEGAYAHLWIYYALYNSQRVYIEKGQVLYRHADRGVQDDIKEEIINHDHGTSIYFATSLNQHSYYYVSVRLFLEINGQYAHVYAYGGGPGDELTLDIQEIKVYKT
jgi:hypothetical protein